MGDHSEEKGEKQCVRTSDFCSVCYKKHLFFSPHREAIILMWLKYVKTCSSLLVFSVKGGDHHWSSSQGIVAHEPFVVTLAAMGSQAIFRSWFHSQLPLLCAFGLSYFTSVNLSFIMCKTEIAVPTSWRKNLKWDIDVSRVVHSEVNVDSCYSYTKISFFFSRFLSFPLLL